MQNNTFFFFTDQKNYIY